MPVNIDGISLPGNDLYQLLPRHENRSILTRNASERPSLALWVSVRILRAGAISCRATES